MRYLLFALYFLLLGSRLLAQDLESQKTLQFSASYMGDAVANFAGGVSHGIGYIGLATVAAELYTDKWWRGGTLFVNLANAHGDLPSNSLVGAFMTISSIEAGTRTYFQDLWYAQTFGRFEVKAGIQDLNIEFSANDVGALFVNSVFGIHATFTDNLAASLYPITGFGGVVKYSTDKHLLKAAVFDGNPNSISFDPNCCRRPFESNDGIMAIAEYGYTHYRSDEVFGSYKIGAYLHNHTLDNDDPNALVKYGKNYGFYGVANQHILGSEGSLPKLGAFAQFAFAPISMNNNHIYYGAGVVASGVLAKKNPDELGLAFACARFAEKCHKHELIFELTYKYEFFKGRAFLQPDLQYVMHPLRYDTELDDAWVWIIRFGVDL